MQYLFFDDEIWQRVYNEIQEWLGTPYYYGVCVKQRGVDCASFIETIMVNCGIFEQKSNIHLPGDWFLHTKEQLLYNNILKILHTILNENLSFIEINNISNQEEILRGDILLFSINSKFQLINHIGLALDNKTFVHSANHRGVIISEIKEYFKKLKRIIRFIKLCH